LSDTSPYWSRFRASRRRLLIISGGAALSAISATVIGCGKESPSTAEPAAGRISTPNNTTALARSGGAFKSYLAAEPPSLDPLASSAQSTLQAAAHTYPRLLKFTPAVYPEFPRGGVEGDLAESFELLPDRLTLTFRLRPGLKWDEKAPTSGRVIDSSDVVASWNRFVKVNPNRYDLLYHAELGPASPVESVSAPNATTVVFKLKQPDAGVLSLFASDRHFYVMPKEADISFDPRIEMRGYGPWKLSENRPGVIKVWSRNPEYYVKGKPYPDTLEQVNAGEYSARLAQFKAGLIWPSVVSQDDLLATLEEMPELILQKLDSYPVAPSMLGFGYDPSAPWKDERLRQAVSMLVDREAFVGLRSNRDAYEDAGLPVEIRYHSAVGAGWEGYWVDPRDVRFGAASRYYRYDPATASQLLSAAGFPEGLDTLLHYSGGMEYSPAYARNAELLSGMLFAGGVRALLDPRSHSDDWLPNFQFGYAMTSAAGKQVRGFAGLVLRPATAQPAPALQLFSMFHRHGSQFHGMTPDGKNAQLGDPEFNRMLETLRREPDAARAQAQTLDFARAIAAKAYDVPVLPFAPSHYSLSWPVIGNLGVYRGWPGGATATETNINLWVDRSQPPLASPTTQGATP